MKKLFFGLTLVMFYCLANASKTPDNEFCFLYGDGITSVKFVYNGMYDDSNQLGNVSYSSSDKQSCISLQSDRNGTKKVANSFNQLVNSDENKYPLLKNYRNPPTFPEKLNFWIGINLSINGNPLTNDLFLGQGHYSAGNNWWMATNSGTYNGCGFLGMTITDASNNQYCVNTNGNLHKVWINAGRCLYNSYAC